MARRLLYISFLLWARLAPAPPMAVSEGDCPLETMTVRVPSDSHGHNSKNFGPAPFPTESVPGAFDSKHVTAMRKTLEKMGLDLDPGREYLNDKDNAVKAVDEWVKDLEKVLQDPAMRAEAEKFVLSYLQTPPVQGAENDMHFHPGLVDTDALAYHRTWAEYDSDPKTFRHIDTVCNTFLNTQNLKDAILAADTFQDPARRSKYISQIRMAYFVETVLRVRFPHRGRYYSDQAPE